MSVMTDEREQYESGTRAHVRSRLPVPLSTENSSHLVFCLLTSFSLYFLFITFLKSSKTGFFEYL